MKKQDVLMVILLMLCSVFWGYKLSADVIVGDENINLTDQEVKKLLNSGKQQIREVENSGIAALKIEAWLELRRPLANDQTEHNRIDNAILVVRILLQREQKLAFDNPPTARGVKQTTIDNEIVAAQDEVNRITLKRDTLIANNADQAEIDVVNLELADANTILETKQAVTVEDFIITP